MRKRSLILLVICQYFSLLAGAFEYTYSGNTVEYTVLSEVSRTCEVASNGTNEGVSGQLILPSKPGGYTLVSIHEYAFSRCADLTSVQLPNTITEIGEGAFLSCKNLKSINIPGSIVSIGRGAFSYCTALKETEFDSLESLCRITFESSESNPLYHSHRLNIGGKEITDLVIPSSIGGLKSYTFINCARLTSIEIPLTVSSIGEKTFLGCNSVESVIIPNSVTEIGNMAFSMVGLVKSAYPSTFAISPFHGGAIVKYPAKNAIIEDGFIYGENKSALYYVPHTIEGEYIVPETVKTIGEDAFNTCVNLESVILNDSLLAIGDYAFNYCYSLTSLKIPDKVNSVGKYICSNCDAMRSLVIGSSVTSLKGIGGHSLSEITCLPLIPPKTSDGTFSTSTYSSATLKVPGGSLEAYKNDEGCWRLFENMEEIKISAESITLSMAKWNGKVGDTMPLTATVIPDNTTNKTIVWSCSNDAIATVSEAGIVTAVSEGVATITAACDEVCATCEITVSPVLGAKIELNTESAEVVKGETLQLSATVLPDNTTDKTVVWSSSDETVAMVSSSGLVVGVSGGFAVITATCGEVSATCQVTVLNTAVLVSEIILSPTSFEDIAGSSFEISAEVLPENASNCELNWSSSDTAVATVEDGVVLFVKEGTAIITAEACDGSGVKSECTVVVSDKTGIENIIEDKSDYVRIFTTAGYLVYEGIYSEAKIAPGVYIVLCRDKIVKTRMD